MTGWSIARAAIAAALVSVAAAPALAQDGYPPSDQGYGQDSASDPSTGGQAVGGGFASRDAAPPDSTPAPPPPPNEDKGWSTWRSAPESSGDSAEAEAGGDAESLDVDPEQAPGTINSFTQPDPTPGFQATTGIANRNQAVSACLAAVRARVGGGAGAARVDGIRGEWMVSGAVADGRAFYCAIHDGAIDDIEFAS